MKAKSITFLCVLLCISLLHSSCGDDTIVRNQLIGTWNIDFFEAREFTNDILQFEEVITNYGTYTFFEDGTGEYYDGFFQDFVWNTDGFELVIILNNQPFNYSILQNGANLQIWQTFIDYGPGDFDEITLRLSRF